MLPFLFLYLLKINTIPKILTSYNADDITFSELVDVLCISGRQSMLPNNVNLGVDAK